MIHVILVVVVPLVSQKYVMVTLSRQRVHYYVVIYQDKKVFLYRNLLQSFIFSCKQHIQITLLDMFSIIIL